MIVPPAERLRAILLAVVLIGATLWPLTWPGSKDDFPFSRWPMFARPQPGREWVVFVEAVNADGTARIVPASAFAAGGFNEARRHVEARSMKASEATAMCREFARRIQAPTRIVREQHDLRKYFARGRKRPLRRAVVASCTP